MKNHGPFVDIYRAQYIESYLGGRVAQLEQMMLKGG